MQNDSLPFQKEPGSAPEPASLEIDLAFLEEFLGEDLDIDEPLLATADPLDLSAPDFRWAHQNNNWHLCCVGVPRCGMLSQLTLLHCSQVATALPALSPFQQSLQQLAPPEPEHRGAQLRPVTPLQTAVRAFLNSMWDC